MPVPLVIAGVASLGAVGGALTASGARAWGAAYLKRQLSRHQKEIEQWALANVFERMGLPDLTDGQGVDRLAFTRAVNNQFLSGSGFEFSNLFDAQAVKNDSLKFALLQVAQQNGLALEHVSIDGMKDAIRMWILEMIQEEISAEEMGELIEDARDVWEIVELYKRYKKAEAEAGGDGSDRGDVGPGDKKPLLMTPEAINNRERQARYRANHKRVWVAK